MGRSTSVLLVSTLLAVAAAPQGAQAQAYRGYGNSTSRMAKYFSNVPIGTRATAASSHAMPPIAAPAYSSAAAYEGTPALPTERPRQPTRLPVVTAPPGPAPMPRVRAPVAPPVETPPRRTAPPSVLPQEESMPPEAPPPRESGRTAPDGGTPREPVDPGSTREEAEALDAVGAPGRLPCEDDGKWWESSACCPSSDCGFAACGVPAQGDPGWRRWLDPRANVFGVGGRGWVDFGGTINTFSPRNRENYPVTFNDRSNDVQMNQLYAILERPVDWDDPRWQVGGRVDVLYGTDHVYTTALGLETFTNGQPKWNSVNGPVGTNYGLAMPQAYMEVYAPWSYGLSVKLGHFYTIMGYESVMAPQNFFYSHAYTMQYGEPFTHTGVLAAWQVTDLVRFQAGFTRGWDTWEDNNNNLGFLGGVTWDLPNDRTSVAVTVHTGPEQDEPPPRDSYRTTYSIVLSHEFSDRLTYVLQHDLGYEPRATVANQTAFWYGINQYLIYQMNACWAAGARFEWFHDKSGARVLGLEGADFYELTLGLNWTPRERLVVRPEVRWDWAHSQVHPFADGTKDHQILVGIDAIVTF